ncbi:type II secretion system F family protein [Blastococcus goldschmidtiae]|uniref:Pilus assembly protein TadB n=1 Tax=Blastococcus goldschmidtiae TaxID=3075546 RepID=A0ABU2KBH2_9ACTN|nr:pilus assembly protein TadB [Blastococcus sp. DSM 46792]MDT0277523.1 pilus assembly protein TadB [Blastococcus sp. DSM 46792]
MLLAATAALLLWPDRRATGRLPGRDTGRPPSGGTTAAGPPTALVAVLAAGAGAAVSTPLVAALAAVAAVAGARAWAGRRAAARNDAGLRGLADGLGALAAELRSGRSLAVAAAAAGSACGDAQAGRLLARAVQAPEVPVRESPGDLADAVGRIAAATRLSMRTGCSLAAVAIAVEDDLRARARHRAELRAATAGPRASAAVLAGLPLLGLLMGSGVGADPWRVLTTTGVGQVLLVGGVALEAVGLAWSHRLVQRALR